MFVISSKNVALLAHDVSDLSKYTEQRYGFAARIAAVWFECISSLDDEGLKSLKSDIDGKNLIGEYVGGEG